VGGRREYGSHGSLDVMGRDREHREHLLAMFPPPSLGEGPAAVSTLTRPTHFNHQVRAMNNQVTCMYQYRIPDSTSRFIADPDPPLYRTKQ
jgi:hypothetical protein